MSNRELLRLLRLTLLGLALAAAGLLFSSWFGSVFNGLQYGAAVVLGMCAYLCVLLVVCTGLLLSRLGGGDKKSH